jgi:hypothetical protein
LSAFLRAGRVKHTNVDVVDRTKNLWGLVVIYSHIFYVFSLVQLSYFGCGKFFLSFSCEDPNRFRKIKFYYYKIDTFWGEGPQSSFVYIIFFGKWEILQCGAFLSGMKILWKENCMVERLQMLFWVRNLKYVRFVVLLYFRLCKLIIRFVIFCLELVSVCFFRRACYGWLRWLIDWLDINNRILRIDCGLHACWFYTKFT